MIIPAPSGYSISVDQGDGLGSPWIVRVNKRSFFRKRRISSDWFLDREQAERFAQEASRMLQTGQAGLLLKKRKPGWTLQRPDH